MRLSNLQKEIPEGDENIIEEEDDTDFRFDSDKDVNADRKDGDGLPTFERSTQE